MQSLSALVLWGPVWRPNQKDVPFREVAARQGVEHYFATSGCFERAEIRRLPGGGAALVPSTPELLSLATAQDPQPDRLIVVTVRELGPVIRFLGSPALIEGGTEVVLEVIVLDVRTGTPLASSRTHWQNGGAFVIKDTRTLPQDMSDALRAALSPARPPQ
jgi:hypothetical protein